MSTVDTSSVTASKEKRTSTKQTSAIPKTITAIYVIDDAMLQNPRCIFQYEDSDVHIPYRTRRDLERRSAGRETNAANAEEALSLLRRIINDSDHSMTDGFPLSGPSNGVATGHMYCEHEANRKTASDISSPDDILSFVRHLQQKYPSREVILVTKNIETHLSARKQKIRVDDDSDERRRVNESRLVRHGYHVLPYDFWDTHEVLKQSSEQKREKKFSIRGETCHTFRPTEFLYSGNNHIAKVTSILSVNGDTVTLKSATDFSAHTNKVFGFITAKNPAQNVALNLLMAAYYECVILRGIAGSGKTLLAIAAGLEQVLVTKQYSEIIYVRPLIDASTTSKDKGAVPGNAKEKLLQWMGGFMENLRFSLKKNPIQMQAGGKLMENLRFSLKKNPIQMQAGGKLCDVTPEMLFGKGLIRVLDPNEMKGATYPESYIIYDEMEDADRDLTKMLLTRKGAKGKVVVLGNIDQISKKSKLTVDTSGLTLADNAVKTYLGAGSVLLPECVRSTFAAHIAKTM